MRVLIFILLTLNTIFSVNDIEKSVPSYFNLSLNSSTVQNTLTGVISYNPSHPSYPSYSLTNVSLSIKVQGSSTEVLNIASVSTELEGNGDYSFSIDISSVVDGNYTADFTINASGNNQTTSPNFTKDTSPPIVTINRNPNAAIVNQQVSVSISNSEISEYQYKIADWQGNFPANWTGPITGTTSVNVAVETNKTYNQKIKIIAKKTNTVYSNEYDFNWNVDTEGPTIISNDLTIDQDISYKTNINIGLASISDVSALTGQWKLNSVNEGSAFDIDQLSFSRLTRAIGDYSLELTATDVLGNSSVLSSNIVNISQTPNPQNMDNLAYSYETNTNRIQEVTDATLSEEFANDFDTNGSNQYNYDENGNLKNDLNRGITNMVYNDFNLPKSLTKSTDTYEYKYNEAGQRTTKLKNGSITNRYLRDASGNVIAEYSNLNGSFKMNYDRVGTGTLHIQYTGGSEVVSSNGSHTFEVDHSAYISGIEISATNGYVEITALEMPNDGLGIESSNLYAANIVGKKYYTGIDIEEIYYLKDHLGNSRVMIRDEKDNPDFSNSARSEQLTVLSANDYYPFGSTISSRSYLNTSTGTDKYKYQGKERDQETGYDYFEARLYDPALARFMQVDPMADMFSHNSSFVSMNNNPISFIDPSGMIYERDLTGGIDTESKNYLKVRQSQWREDFHARNSAKNSSGSQEEANYWQSHDLEIEVDQLINKAHKSGQNTVEMPDPSLPENPYKYVLLNGLIQQNLARGLFNDQVYHGSTGYYPLEKNPEAYRRTDEAIDWFYGYLTGTNPPMLDKNGNPYTISGVESWFGPGKFLKFKPWIARDLFKNLPKLVGNADYKKFKAALQKGIVGPTGQSGIKRLSGSVNGYTHELKIGGSAQRILGKYNEKGVLIFDKFIRGGLH